MKAKSINGVTSKKRGRYGFYVLGLPVVAVLIYALFRFGGLNLSDIFEVILSLPSWVLFAHLGMTLLNLLIGARKWQYVVAKTSPKDEKISIMYSLMVTSTGAFLGRFMPIQLSTMGVRSLSLKKEGYGSLSKGAATSLISQVLDVYVIALFLLPGILFITNIISPQIWLTIVIILVISGFLILLLFLETFGAWGLRFLERNERSKFWKNNIFVRIKNLLKQGLGTALFTNRTIATLFGLSLLRFINLVARSFTIFFALEVGLSPLPIFSIASITQLSLAIAITPGNFGIREWTWIGLLSLTGVGAESSAQFALINRVFGLTSITLASLLIGFIYWIWRLISRQKNS